MKSLAEAVADNPYLEYHSWWPIGKDFMAMMRAAIVSTWEASVGKQQMLPALDETFIHYTQTVYQRAADPHLPQIFLAGELDRNYQSGEFDGLSYTFFHSAFTQQDDAGRHRFTQAVGRRFFASLANTLRLTIPADLATETDFAILQAAIAQIGQFLVDQGYLRDHFSFRFDLDAVRNKNTVRQKSADFMDALLNDPPAYALYEMGFPAILPSAVYLFQTMGEAQHHSSRTIEELFAQVRCTASETDDFDPAGFPANRVVELWEIHRNR